MRAGFAYDRKRNGKSKHTRTRDRAAIYYNSRTNVVRAGELGIRLHRNKYVVPVVRDRDNKLKGVACMRERYTVT